MKKLSLISVLCGLSIPAVVQAHDLWAYGLQAEVDKPLQAVLGYGDRFPLGEKIAESRLNILNPLVLHKSDGSSETLMQQGENYHYVTKKNLAKGEYKISASYKPTFWSKNEKGWKRENLTNMPDATYCEESSMFATTYINTGVDVSDFSIMPVGLPLEIVPLVDPTDIRPLEAVPFQVLYNGKPAKEVVVIGTTNEFTKLDEKAVYDHREPQAFSGKTDAQGKINFIPALAGTWKIKASYEMPYPEAKVCQKRKLYSTYTFQVNAK
ncbi:nickel ABC transporter permease [Gallibacterium genomosp. 3]|uniref:Nickel ABC transporter permease n=1 Tax=Gallibacterium genomosp. 3 TaxID=505345 RepID=A0A1A7PTR1_9PAST|nr:DUF4198 domain-containing protein [Gallibacterium genomosp. 3]OBX05434.1 nickel ABC transporter permease [Gallibacterium genomosp. 3]